MARNQFLFVTVFLISLTSAYYSCSKYQSTHQMFPPIGVPVQLKEVTTANPGKAHNEYSNILLYLVLGSRTHQYGEGATFEFYANKGDPSSVYKFTSEQIREASRTTNCAPSATAFLDNALDGDALFCNKSFDISKVNYFVTRLANGKTKTATSYVIDFVRENDDLIAITINMD